MSEALFFKFKGNVKQKEKNTDRRTLEMLNVTADSLGPKVVNNLYITRHLQKRGLEIINLN